LWQATATTLEGFAAGKIELPKPKGRDGNKSGMMRVAPSFIRKADAESISGHQEMLYTAETLAEFLRWPIPKVEAVLSGLAAVEERCGQLPHLRQLIFWYVAPRPYLRRYRQRLPGFAATAAAASRPGGLRIG
jgi:hypothetical protein